MKSAAGPRTIAAQLSNNIVEHNVPGGCPRDVHQISNYRKRLRAEGKTDDEFKEILLYSSEDEVGKYCIRNLQFHNSGLRFVFALPAQLEEIISSCCSLTMSCGVLSIDTTFNIGKFFVTPTSYPLKAFVNKRTKKSVNMPGPCLFHVEDESAEVYLYFAHSLVEANPNVDRVRFIGGDRGKGQRGFMRPFRSATLLPCTRHIQNNMLEQIGDKETQNKILRDLFGSAKEKKKGLVDCTHATYDATLHEMSKNWPGHFTAYFETHVKDDMKEGMLADVREAAGLGMELYYNNALECLNKKLKNKKRERHMLSQDGACTTKPCTLMEAVQIYKDLVFEERCFLHQAIIGCGPYGLAPNFKHFGIDEIKFCQMSVEEKRQALAKLDPFLKQKNIQPFIANGLLSKILDNAK